MPKKRPLSRDEKLARREEIARRAAAGGLRLPEAVRDIRNALGMTQAEFADKFGLTRTQLIDLEKGRANPTHETLARIGKPFGFVVGFVPRAPRSEPDGAGAPDSTRSDKVAQGPPCGPKVTTLRRTPPSGLRLFE